MNNESTCRLSVSRRDSLKLAGAAFAVGLTAGASRSTTRPKKRVVIGGGGIVGLSCAYELMKRGHDVTLLEASGQTGGHVRTFRDPFADGLYADAGAEHITKPGYELFWRYLKEFNLSALPYPRRENLVRILEGKQYTEEMLADRTVLAQLGFNQREIECLGRHEWWELPLLYCQPYLDAFEDEYRPFAVGLNHLDQVPVNDLLRKDGASRAAMRFIGHATTSALQRLWHTAILKIRRVPLWPPRVFRVQGGNQVLTDTFTARLGDRVRLGAPITSIRHGGTGVAVKYREFGRSKTMEADYLVCCMSALMLRRIEVTPALA